MLEQRAPLQQTRFTDADLDFLTAILAPGKKAHLETLWNDPDALREMLDLKEVFRGLLESPSAIQVSPRFYFYVLVRHTFLQANLSDADLANYVAYVMAKRICPPTGDPLQDIVGGYTHVSDFIAVISNASGRMRFHLQLAAGNQFLILTGLYPTFLKRRNELHGTPGLEFYESFAKKSFKDASNNHWGPGKAARQMLGELSDALPEARRSLNRLAEEYVFLGE